MSRTAGTNAARQFLSRAAAPVGVIALLRRTGNRSTTTVAPTASSASQSGPRRGTVTVTLQPRSIRYSALASVTRSDPYNSEPGWAIRMLRALFGPGPVRDIGNQSSGMGNEDGWIGSYLLIVQQPVDASASMGLRRYMAPSPATAVRSTSTYCVSSSGVSR